MRDVIETTVPGLVLVPKKRVQSQYHVITGWGTPLAWCSCERKDLEWWRCPVIREWIEENSSERIPG